MSNHLLAPPNPNPDDTSPVKTDDAGEKKKVLDLSLTQIAGGALAAMTAAALGSTLGVAGTIAGAAVASIVAGVAGSLYTASLRTGHEKVRTVFRGNSTDAATAPPPAAVDARTTVVSARMLHETQIMPVWDPLPLDRPGKRSGRSNRSPFPWKRAAAVAISVFVLAAVLITGYERFSGQSLSGGTGTTVSQVQRDTSGDTKDDKPTATESTPTPSASSTPSASESASASPAAGGAPSASESTDSPTPSATASESTPDSTPSPSG